MDKKLNSINSRIESRNPAPIAAHRREEAQEEVDHDMAVIRKHG